MIEIEKYISLSFVCVLAFCLCGCSYIQKRMDISGLNELAADIAPDARTCSPEKLRAFTGTLSLKKDTEPSSDVRFTVSPLTKWHMKHPSGGRLIMEKVTFPSLIKHRNGPDMAAFYIYRTGELKNKKVILWIPGAGVSDLAFHFIKHFFLEGLIRDYDIVFYVPPYHMERTEPEQKNGAGLFTSNPERNISVLLNSVRELRTIISYLKQNGVTRIGGWGGSIGATTLLLTEQTEEFDHINIMIPVINLETVVLKNDHMREALAQFAKAGFSEALLEQAYAVVNPARYGLKVDPNRVQIMYAEYDQLTPVGSMLTYAGENKIKKLIAYPRSHATILLTGRLYNDYGLFLDSLEDAK